MKEIEVKNYKNIDGEKMGQDGNTFICKMIVDRKDACLYTASFVEVKPGNFAYGYHYHEVNEEIFYIISGEGIVKTIKGDIKVKSGDAITFPTGEKGAHVIRNASNTETLVYLDFGTNNKAEIVHLLDAKKVMAVGPYSKNIYDAK